MIPATASPSTQLVRLPRLQSALRHLSTRQVPFHTHTATELVFTQSGEIQIDVGGKTLPGKAGVLYILPPNVPHNQRSSGKWGTQCILFFHAAHLFDPAPRTLDISSDPQTVRWIEELCALHESQTPAPDAVSNGFLYALLSRVESLEAQRNAAGALHPRLAQAVQFIHEHLTEDIDADTLSSFACASYSHLSSLFRDAFGCGPLKYQQNLRLASAQKLLRNPYVSLDEVAAQLGYEDTNYFVRVFRKTVGVPPGKWRKQNVRQK